MISEWDSLPVSLSTGKNQDEHWRWSPARHFWCPVNFSSLTISVTRTHKYQDINICRLSEFWKLCRYCPRGGSGHFHATVGKISLIVSSHRGQLRSLMQGGRLQASDPFLPPRWTQWENREADALGRGIPGEQCLLFLSDGVTVLMHFTIPTVLCHWCDVICMSPLFPALPPLTTATEIAGLVLKSHII